MKALVFVLITAVGLALGACSGGFGFPGVYRINIEQGNIVTEEMVSQLKQGMSRRQVRFIMGTPLIEDTFHSNRWDYHYLLRNGDQTIREQRVTVVFDEDRLQEVEGDIRPVWAGGTAGQKPEPENVKAADTTAESNATDA